MIVRYTSGPHMVLIEVVGYGAGKRRRYVFRLLGVPPEPAPLEEFLFYLDAVRGGIEAAERELAKPAH